MQTSIALHFFSAFLHVHPKARHLIFEQICVRKSNSIYGQIFWPQQIEEKNGHHLVLTIQFPDLKLNGCSGFRSGSQDLSRKPTSGL